MRIMSENIIPGGAVSLAASSNLQALWIGHVAMAGFQFVVTGTPVGTLKLQVSCDEGAVNSQSIVNQTARVTNWTDLAGASVAVSAAGTYVLNIVDPGYHWVRVVYTASSGTGSLTSARINTKGV